MKTKRLLKTIIAASFMAAFISGCKDENTEKVGICPKVTSTNPAHLATDVPVDQILTVIFNGAMDPASITSEAFTLSSSGSPGGRTEQNQISGVLDYNSSNHTLSFTPNSPLVHNATYTGKIGTKVKDLLGNAMQVSYSWTFSTCAIIAPEVVSTDPPNAATDIALTKKVSATFDMPMDPLTLSTTTFTIKLGATSILGTVSYTGTTATFTPSNHLLTGATYTATITTGAKNLGGQGLVADKVWTFSTVAPLASLPPALGTICCWGAISGNAGITNQGLYTIIDGGGIVTTAPSTLVTGFHDWITGDIYTETPLNVGMVTGGIFTAPPAPGTASSEAIATQGLTDATAAYGSISPASKPGGVDPGEGELGGLTLPPGIYKSAGATFNVSLGNLTLDAQGDANAVWIFQTKGELTVGTAGPTGARSVILINGARPKNVFWYVGSAATINAAGGGIMVGTIIANSTVFLSTAGNTVQTTLYGRAISLTSSVNMVNTTIKVSK
jgi:hypothetical protein